MFNKRKRESIIININNNTKCARCDMLGKIYSNDKHYARSFKTKTKNIMLDI